MQQVIKSIDIEDFKCHEKLQWIFSEGITVFVAPNGKGKSSFVEAICWCLFGSTVLPYTQEELIREGAEKCSVVLDLHLDGEDYTFQRSFSVKEGARAAIYHYGELIANKSSGVAEFLKGKGIDYDGFQMIYAEQGSVSFFVYTTPAVRKTLISSLFRIDELTDIASEVRADIKQIKEDTVGLPSEDEMKEIGVVLDNCCADCVSAQVELSAVEGTVYELRGRIDVMSADAKLLPKKIEIQSKVAALEAAIITFYGQIGDLDEADPHLQGINGSSEVVEVTQSALAQLHTTLEAVLATSVSAMHNIQIAEEKIVLLEDGACPTCGMGGEHIFLVLKSEREQREMLLDSYRSIQVNYEKLLKEYAELNTVAAFAAENYVVIRKWEESGSDTLRTVLYEKLEEYKAQKVACEKELEELPEFDADAFDALLLEERRTSELFTEASKNLLRANRKIGNARQQAASAVELSDGAKPLLRKGEVMQQLVKEVPKFRDTVLAQSLAWVSNRSSELLTAALETPKVVEVDTDLNFWLDSRKLRTYSSGQVDLAAVCIRIAIAEYLSARIGFRGLLILDGVFDRIDEDNRDAIGKLLSEVNIGQVMLLSHFNVPVVGGRELRIR